MVYFLFHSILTESIGVSVIVSIGLLLFFNRESKIGIMFQTVIWNIVVRFLCY